MSADEASQRMAEEATYFAHQEHFDRMAKESAEDKPKPKFSIVSETLVNVHSDDLPVEGEGDFNCEVSATITFRATSLEDAQDFIHNLCYGMKLKGDADGATLWIDGEEDSVEVRVFEE